MLGNVVIELDPYVECRAHLIPYVKLLSCFISSIARNEWMAGIDHEASWRMLQVGVSGYAKFGITGLPVPALGSIG